MGKPEEGKKIAYQLLEESRKVGNKVKEFDAIINILMAFRGLEKMSEGLKLAKKEEDLLEKLSEGQQYELKRREAAFFFEVGALYFFKGEVVQVLEYFQKSLTLSETIKDQESIVKVLGSIGYIYLSKGELDHALSFFQKSLPLHKIIGNRQIPADILNSIGIVYTYKGELEQGIEFYNKSLTIYEEIDSQFNISRLLSNIGQAYGQLGNSKTAVNYFERALNVSRKIKSDGLIVEILYNQIKYFVKDLPYEAIMSYLNEMKEFKEHYENYSMSYQKYRLAKAIVLKSSDRLTDKSSSQIIFRQIAEEDIVWHELTVDALLNLGELLVFELEITGKEAVLTELNELIERLQTIAKNQQSFWLIAETYLLQSKLALFELNLEKTEQLLTQAELVTAEKGLHKLALTISLEQDSLSSNLSKWKKIIDLEPSISERIELTQLSTLFERFILKKFYRTEKEIRDYAASARQIVEEWVK